MILTPCPDQHFYAIKPFAPHSFSSLSIKRGPSAAEGLADVSPGHPFPWGWHQETKLVLKTTSLLLSCWALVNKPWATTARAFLASRVKWKFNWEKKTIIWENKTLGPFWTEDGKHFTFVLLVPAGPAASLFPPVLEVDPSTPQLPQDHHLWGFLGSEHHSRALSTTQVLMVMDPPGQAKAQAPACTFALLATQAAVQHLNPSFQNL